MRKHLQTEVQQISKKKKKSPILQWIRTGLQISFFIWLPSLYISAFAGLKELITSLVSGTFSISAIWPDLLAFLAAVPLTILAGRFFCGWMCAFGSLTDWIFGIFSPWTKNRVKIPPQADRILKGLKYAVLAGLLILGVAAGSVSLSAMSPWDAFGMLFTVGAVPAIGLVLKSLLPGFILLVITLVASAFVERFFCRYMCPMGAFFAVTSIARMVYIDKPRDKCGKCQICTKNCAMGIPLNQMDQVKSGECIGCMKCVDVCPRKNVQVHVNKARVNPLAIASVLVVLITGLFMIETVLANSAKSSETQPIAISTSVSEQGTPASESGSAISDSASSTGETATSSTSGVSGSSSATSASGVAPTTASSSAATTAAATTAASTAATTAAGKYADGTYTGSGTGFRGTTTVQVTVSGGQITDIAVVSYDDDRPYFEKAFSSISSSVISTQGTAVDTVSSATYSSNGIIDAISSALSQA